MQQTMYSIFVAAVAAFATLLGASIAFFTQLTVQKRQVREEERKRAEARRDAHDLEARRTIADIARTSSEAMHAMWLIARVGTEYQRAPNADEIERYDQSMRERLPQLEALLAILASLDPERARKLYPTFENIFNLDEALYGALKSPLMQDHELSDALFGYCKDIKALRHDLLRRIAGISNDVQVSPLSPATRPSAPRPHSADESKPTTKKA